MFDGFYDEHPEHALMHGPTFMGNALACSVALKSIELFETGDYMSKIKRNEAITRREMEGFTDTHSSIYDIPNLNSLQLKNTISLVLSELLHGPRKKQMNSQKYA